MILLQDPNIPVATNPVEIDAAIIDILSELNIESKAPSTFIISINIFYWADSK